MASTDSLPSTQFPAFVNVGIHCCLSVKWVDQGVVYPIRLSGYLAWLRNKGVRIIEVLHVDQKHDDNETVLSIIDDLYNKFIATKKQALIFLEGDQDYARTQSTWLGI